MSTGTPLGRMVVELGLDTADFGKGVKGATKEVTYLAKEMQANMKIADLAGNKMGVLGSKYDGLSKIIEAQDKKVVSLTKAYNESFDENGKATDATLRYANQLQQANGQLANYKKQLANTAGEMAEWKIKNEGLTGSLNTFGKRLGTAGEYTEAFGKKLTVAVTAPVVAFTTGLVKMGLEVRTFRAQSQIFYEGLYQDTTKAKQQLDDLMTFAKTTPYAYESLVKADMVMHTFGMSTEKAKVALEAIANAIAATGGSSADLEKIATVFGQIESSGKLSLQDMNQLVNAKIPALKIVANELGISVMDLRTEISKGHITSEKAINALTKGLMQGTDGMNGATQAYSGALDKVKQQLPGAVDSLKSAFKNLALQLVDEEAFDKVIESINKITHMLKNGQFTPIIKSISNVLKDTVDLVGNLAMGFANLNPKTQESIMKFIAYSAAMGPILTITGKTAKGLGNVTTKTVGLLGVLAKKKTISEFAGQLVSGSNDIIKWGKAATEGAKATTAMGGAAVSASGSGGIGALTGALGALGPVAIGIAAAIGVGGVGYLAWKTFGEEAYNSSQRVKRWGTDVGAVTDSTLVSIQKNTQSASGQFGLMADGVATDSTSMIANIEAIGKTIEESLNKKIDTLKGMLAELPENFDATMRSILEKEIVKSEESLKIVTENSQKISDIKKNAADNDRALTVEEAAMIRNLAKETTSAYIDTLDVSQKEKKKILNAMNGDVEKASKEEAKLWLQSLGQQRADAQDHINDLRDLEKDKLEEMGYDLNGEFAQNYIKAWDEAHKTTLDGFDTQMAIIAEKYPELLDEVYLSNGKLTSNMRSMSREVTDMSASVREANERMLAGVITSSTEGANKLNWVADQATDVGEKWNALIFDPKTGEVKTNVREVVREATKDVDGWNALKPVIHDANLDSNAKSVIGEAAIVNGYWDDMDWKEQHVILHDSFSNTMYNILHVSGKWDTMTLDEKTAFMYSNTPEIMTETMLYLGMWDDYNPDIKKIKAENFEFLDVLSKSEEKMIHWKNIPEETKILYADNYDFLKTVYESEETYGAWVAMPDSEKNLLADNTELLLKLLQSEDSLKRWNDLPAEDKKLLAINKNVLESISTSETKYNQWMALPENEKKILGNNSDLLAKVFSSTEKYDQWTLLSDDEKFMLGNNTDLLNKISTSSDGLKAFNDIPITDKNLTAIDNASGPANDATKAVNEFSKKEDKTVTLTTVIKQMFENVGTIFKNENGTNFHPGGAMLVNDQRGMLYKELVEFPNGQRFVPEGRNVLIADAPRGTKVYTADQTKNLIPKYASGVGVPKNAQIIKNLDAINNGNVTLKVDSIDYSQKLDKVITLLEKVIKKENNNPDIISAFEKALKNINIQTTAIIDKNSIAKETMPEINRKLSIDSMLKKRGI